MNIHQAYTKSDSNTPIVIITCKNVNVAKIIIDVAKTKVIRCHPIALGTNGQREVAQKMMLTAPGQGIWLVLENGHLDLPYLAAIPRTMEEIHYSDEHFRLYITAEAAPNFPTNLLEIALRQYAEPAIGLKAKMISSLSWIEQDMIDSSSTSNWITLLYSMSFLHSWMLARKEFVQSAWCEQHEFHRSDLLMSFHFMQSIIEANENKGRGMLRVEVPWPTVQQVFAEIILGSALNQVDQVVLETQIKRYMSTRILSSDFHYGLDFPGPFGKDFQSTIRQLGIQTLNETAEVFGLDAWVGWETEEIRSDNTLTCLRLALSSNSEPTFPTTIQGNEHFILESATRMLGEMPQSLEPELDALKPPYNLLASSECYQLNRVLGIARNDLRNVVENLKNGLQFTSKNDSIAKAMLLGQTPKRWMSLSFGIQSLATWSSHLRESHSQVSARMRGVQGPVAIGHCFSPASVIRHHLLYVCSKHRWPHESAKLTLKISGADGGAGETAKELVLTGILLEGAGWDSRHSKLVITPATAGKRTLMPLPPARLIVEQGHGGTQTVVGDSVVACKVPLYPSKSHRGGEAILEAALMTVRHVPTSIHICPYPCNESMSMIHARGEDCCRCGLLFTIVLTFAACVFPVAGLAAACARAECLCAVLCRRQKLYRPQSWHAVEIKNNA
jgi:dynein heavy chain